MPTPIENPLPKSIQKIETIIIQYGEDYPQHYVSAAEYSSLLYKYNEVIKELKQLAEKSKKLHDSLIPS